MEHQSNRTLLVLQSNTLFSHLIVEHPADISDEALLLQNALSASLELSRDSVAAADVSADLDLHIVWIARH